MDCPGRRTVPTVGNPLAVNGAAGPGTAVTVSSGVPGLVTLTVRDLSVPTAMSPKSTVAGVAVRPGLMALPCRPAPSVWLTPASMMANRSAPVNEPGEVGANETGTEMVWPAVRVTGSAGTVAANGGPVVLTAVTVTVRVAVAVTVAVPVRETSTSPKGVCVVCSAAVVGWPKP